MLFGRTAKILFPPAVSATLLAVVIWWVSPARLAEAAAELNWQLLVPATAIMVVALYLWDAVCLPTVYRVAGGRITYQQARHLRGLTYVGGSLNYELGQGALAWGMARLQGVSVLPMLARTVLLAYHDIVVLLAAGSLGSLLTNDPRVVRIRPYIVGGLVIALAVGALVWLLPGLVRTLFRWKSDAPILDGWSLARSAKLLPLRVVYFGILLVYATVALAICHIHVDWQVVLSTVPLVLLADGVPTFAGLGSREAMLHFVLAPGESNPTLVAMSLLWTIGMIVGRLMIATVHLWLHRARLGAAKLAPSKSPVAVDERETSTPAPDDDALRRTA